MNTYQGCANCVAHGLSQNGVVTLPCSSCALDAGYEWPDSSGEMRQTFGVSGFSAPNETTLEELVESYVYLVRPRYIEDRTGIPEDQTVDNFILSRFLPDNAKSLYNQLVLSLDTPSNTSRSTRTWADVVAGN